MMLIAPLKEHLGFQDDVADCFYQQWGPYYPERSFQDWKDSLSQKNNLYCF